MSLADEAIRLRRCKWSDRADLLAEELYVIFLQQKDPETGPISITFPNGDAPATILPGSVRGPLGDFVFPDLNLPDLNLGVQQPEVTEEPLGEEGLEVPPVNRTFLRETTTRHDQRSTIPGIVMGGEGPYAMNVFPNGTAERGQSVNGAVDLSGSATLPVGTWALVFFHTAFNLIKSETVKKGPGIKGEEIVDTQTRIEIIRQDIEFAGGSGGSSSAFPAKITAGGPGTEYTADIYTSGTGEDPISAAITQLDIDSADTIPADTWVIAVQVGGVYYCNAPIWVSP